MSTSAVTSSSSSASSGGTALIQGTSYTSGVGIDVTSTVDAIIASDQAPEAAWKSDQAALTAEEAALTKLQGEVGTIQTSFQSLNDLTGVFSGVQATSANPAVVSATTTSTAISGTHHITIQKLASTGTSYSNTVTGTNPSMAAGALVFTLGSGAPQTINIPGDSTTTNGVTTTAATTTLANAAAYINKQNSGITASVVTDSTGSRLSLASSASGSAASISVQSAPGGLTFTNVAGQDANLTVDGVPLVSSTNKLTTAITGVTLNLTGLSDSEIELDVAPDTTKITMAINSFVAAYNAAITDLNAQFQTTAGATSSSNTSGVLQTDSAAQEIQQELLSSISVMTTGNSTYKTLASLGIAMANDGTLSVDSTKLAGALDSNYSEVQNFFQSTDSASFGANFSNIVMNLTDTTDSPIVLDLNSMKSTYTADQKNIDDLEANLANLRVTLVAKYSALDALLKTFPSEMDQINTELGFNNSSNSSNGG